MSALVIISLLFLSYYIYKNFFSKTFKDNNLQVSNYEEGKVYLIQIPISPHVRSISPFALKLESWLRKNGIPFENRFSRHLNNRHQTPYIEYNGKVYPDSNLIIHFLKEEFKIDPDEHLSVEESNHGYGRIPFDSNQLLLEIRSELSGVFG